MSDNESSLIDEDDDVAQHLGGLSFSDEKPDASDVVSDVSIPQLLSSELPITPQQRASCLHFEVTDAKIIAEGRSKFVLYTILVKNKPSDLSPVSIERRYSEFEQLNSLLRKTFSHNNVMKEVVFPKKQLIGNYKAQTIAARSRSFEQFLSHLGSIQEIPLSNHFKHFLYGSVNDKALDCFKSSAYVTAVPLIRRMLRLQVKIYGNIYEDTVISMAALTVCFLELEGCEDKAEACSEAAVKCLCDNNDHPLLFPLLQLAIRLCWKLGKEKQDLESRLQKLGRQAKDSFSVSELKELVVHEWKSLV